MLRDIKLAFINRDAVGVDEVLSDFCNDTFFAQVKDQPHWLELPIEMPWRSEIDAAYSVAYAIIGVEDSDPLIALFYCAKSFACMISDDEFIT